jgi:molybdopterin synthase sulfur carrier subunit
MPNVWIPALMRDLTGGEEMVRISGQTVQQVIENLEKRFPGIQDRLCDQDGLRPNINVIVDGEVSHRRLRQALSENSEVHFLPVMSGGD